jgi:hypothetical protein
MSSVKISGLPASSNLNVNPSQSLFPTTDLGTGVTTHIDAGSLGNSLYANNTLTVGSGGVVLPNIVAQFTGINQQYVQVNLQNIGANGSADLVITGDTGTDSNTYLDLGFNNSSFVNTGYTSMGPNDGYLYVQGTGNTTVPSGNLIVGTASPNTEIKFMVGGTNDVNVVMKIKSNEIKSRANTVLNVANTLLVNTITFYDNTSLNSFSVIANHTSNIANLQVSVANNTANISNLQISVANNAANIANLQLYSNSAYAKANSALANATGTFAGDLTITGNTFAQAMNTANLIVNGTGNITGTLNVTGVVNMNAQVVLTNTSFSATQAALTIAASNTVATPSQDGYMLHVSGKQNVSSRIVSDSFGANTYALYAGRAARGNVANPSAIQTNDILARFSGNGYGTTKYQTFGVGRIDFVAQENYTDANTGSQIQFWTTPIGTNTVTQIATFNGTSVIFTGTVQPQKGFIYTPTIYPGAQTAITIDFANNSLVRAQTASSLTVTLSNLLAGKEVVAWITNTSGTNQTFTHGLSATNSTVNSTTYAIPSTSTILARYMSIDGTTQNTFVAVTHA